MTRTCFLLHDAMYTSAIRAVFISLFCPSITGHAVYSVEVAKILSQFPVLPASPVICAVMREQQLGITLSIIGHNSRDGVISVLNTV